MAKNVSVIEKYISKEALSGVILFLATVLAVVVANSSFGEGYVKFWQTPLGLHFGEIDVTMTLTYWIDDGLMALFFLMVGLEIKREVMLGELSNFHKALFPIIAAIGGMVVPALVYVWVNPESPIGFGIPMATDIAFALGILMLFGSRVNPAVKIFLVALAVVDDLGAILVVATVYTSEIHTGYFLHASIVYALIWLLNIRGVTSLLPYLVLGLFLWVYIHAIGVHATIAGVLLAIAIPLRGKIDQREFVLSIKEYLKRFETTIDNQRTLLSRHQRSALEDVAYAYDRVQNPIIRLEHNLHSLSAFVIMPLFAFSNAGVVLDFSGVETHLNIVLGVMLGLIVGKPVGIFGFTYLATKLNLVQKPDELLWQEILAVGFIAGIGFTMSIFITHLAFSDQVIIDAVKLGVFAASFVSAVIGVILLLGVKR